MRTSLLPSPAMKAAQSETTKPPSNSFDKVIGQNVRALMKAKGLVMEDLCDIIGINSSGVISELLGGKRRWNTSYLKAITDHFKCPVAALFVGATALDVPAQMHAGHANLAAAYTGLSDRDKAMVDFILYGEKKDATLMPAAASAEGHSPRKG